jgi:hypothetical protein
VYFGLCFTQHTFGFVFVFSNWFVFWSKATFGFKPCVFDLRQLGQKMAFEINIGLQMYKAKTQAKIHNTQIRISCLYIRIRRAVFWSSRRKSKTQGLNPNVETQT